jgi:predicted CopG family antitoxin
MNTRKTVMVDVQVYEKLKKHGKFGETFSELILRLLNEVEEGKKLKK